MCSVMFAFVSFNVIYFFAILGGGGGGGGLGRKIRPEKYIYRELVTAKKIR